MTIEVTDILAGPYTPNGATTDFPFAFKIPSVDEVRVFQVLAGVETDLDHGLFTVVISTDTEGGSINFTEAPATGSGDIYIEPDPLFTQPAVFSNAGFLPRTLNPVLDRLSVAALWLRSRLDRAISFPFGEVGLTLPPAADRIGSFLGFGSDGLPTLLYGTLPEVAALASNIASDGMSTVQADLDELAARGQDVFSVKRFGAVGDQGDDPGTDDRAAIQAAASWRDASTVGAFQIFFPNATRQYRIANGLGTAALTIQSGTAWIGSSNEATALAIDADADFAYGVVDANSAAKVDIRNLTVTCQDNPNILAVFRLGYGAHPFGTYGTMDQVTARNAPNGWGFDFVVNVQSMGTLYAEFVKHGLRSADGGSGMHLKGFYPISWDGIGLWLGGEGDCVMNTEFEAPNGPDATCCYQSRNSSLGLGQTIVSLQAGLIVKTLFAYNSVQVTGFRAGPINLLLGALAGFGDVDDPAVACTATAVGLNTITYSSANWKRDQFKNAALLLKNIVSASMSGGVMTVADIISGSVQPGQVIDGAGVSEGNTVVAQLTGSPGSTGTYSTSIAETVGVVEMTLTPTFALIAGNSKDTISIYSSVWEGVVIPDPQVGDLFAVDYMMKGGSTTGDVFEPDGSGHMTGLDLTIPDAAITVLSNERHTANQSTVGSSNDARPLVQRMSKVVAVNLPNILANTSGFVDVTFADATVGCGVSVTAPSSLGAQGIIVSGACDTNGTIRVTGFNVTVAAVNASSVDCTIEVRKYG